MKRLSKDFALFLRNPITASLAVAVTTVAALFALQQWDNVPFEGASVSSAGPLPSISRPFVPAARPAGRGESSVMATISPGCAAGDGEACIQEVLQGGIACFADARCRALIDSATDPDTSACPLDGKTCATVRQWMYLYTAFAPECLGKQTADCQNILASLVGDNAPAAVQPCLQSVACREMLASFRHGDPACAVYAPCQMALQALVTGRSCQQRVWCQKVESLLGLSTLAWQNCPEQGAGCISSLKLDRFALATRRDGQCAELLECSREVIRLLQTFVAGTPDVTCLQWKECKDRLLAFRNHECSAHSADCTLLTRELAYFAANPLCIIRTMQSCRDGLAGVGR